MTSWHHLKKAIKAVWDGCSMVMDFNTIVKISYTSGWNGKSHSQFLKQISSLTNLIKYVTYGPAIPILFYPRVIKSCVHTKTCISMFIAILFIIIRK